MKKVFILIILTAFILINVTACSKSNKPSNMINSKRRFAEYVEPQNTKDIRMIDLSEGPKLDYDAKLGPKNLNFDIKIVDPY